MFRWLSGRGASQRAVAHELGELTDERWRAALECLPFLRGLSPAEDEALRHRAAWLLASKSFSGAHGIEVTDAMMLSISMQAALPILNLDPVLYEGWTEIVVYPGGFLIPCVDVDEAGVVHEYVQEASGEAWEGGPVILSWEDTRLAGQVQTNVVIHEFAHKLDRYSGEADGLPSLHAHPGMSAGMWRQVLEESLNHFTDALTKVEDAIPSDVDPESDEAAPWFDALPLDPYAASEPAEFFAVSSETFFVNPAPLARAMPQWYELLKQYYRQDPLGRLA